MLDAAAESSSREPRPTRLRRRVVDLLAAVGVVALTLATGRFVPLNATSIGLLLLLAVLAVAVWRGLLASLVATLLATAGFNYLFLPPVGTWTIEDVENWVALGCFLVASVIGSQLIRALRRRTAQAAAAEALRQSDALRTAVLRAVSHDLRSPLTAMALELAGLRRTAPAEIAPQLDQLDRERERLTRRIDNLLALARLEGGLAQVHREPTPPADLLRAAREALGQLLRGRPLAASIAPDCPDLSTDPALTLEILVNLLENAARLSPAGEPIEVVMRPAPGEETVLVEVRDRGPGLPPELAARYGAVEPPADAPAAAGLGLEIARGLARANGGSLLLQPRDGGGTVARLRLPAASTAALEPT